MTETPSPFIKQTKPIDDPARILLTGTTTLNHSRLTVFFRSLLVLPQSIVLSVCVYGFFLVYWVGWIGALFLGHLPVWAYNFSVWLLRFQAYLNCYTTLLTRPWPPFSGSDEYPISLRISDTPIKQSRIDILFRIVFIIPAYIIALVLSIPSLVFWVIMWFSGVILGRVPEGLLVFQLKVQQYGVQLAAYLIAVTNVYPKFEDTEVSIVKE